jgi:hypothetical protein
MRALHNEPSQALSEDETRGDIIEGIAAPRATLYDGYIDPVLH